jgi:hypothetical protein
MSISTKGEKDLSKIFSQLSERHLRGLEKMREQSIDLLRGGMAHSINQPDRYFCPFGIWNTENLESMFQDPSKGCDPERRKDPAGDYVCPIIPEHKDARPTQYDFTVLNLRQRICFNEPVFGHS